jgi:predicted nucleotidyltransferase
MAVLFKIGLHGTAQLLFDSADVNLWGLHPVRNNVFLRKYSTMPSSKITVPLSKIAEFCRQHRVRELSLFGSVLREDFGPESDLDVLVEFEPSAEVDLFEFSGMRLELIGLFGRPIDLVIPAALKPLIKDAILENRRVVYAV